MRVVRAAIVTLLVAPAVLLGERSVSDVVRRFGQAAESRLEPHFVRAGAAYPPKKAAFVVFKEERRFELWATDTTPPRLVRSYPIQAASGGPGPKLREGDLQVPEGLYRIPFLNPNSLYHLSMKVDYPNAFDRRMAARDRRTRLGGDIFIHGKDVSIGCVALGDEAIEELFVLVARTGAPNVRVVIAPWDLRLRKPPLREDLPWSAQLYAELSNALALFPLQ